MINNDTVIHAKQELNDIKEMVLKSMNDIDDQNFLAAVLKLYGISNMCADLATDLRKSGEVFYSAV